MTEELPPAGYAADVPHPAVGVSIEVPDHWVVLDLNPDTWDTWLDAFLDQRLASRPDAVGERAQARAVLLDLLRQLHGEKVFMAAILAADVGGELVSASATLAWRELDLDDGEKIELEGLRQVYVQAPPAAGEDMEARSVERVELPCGGAVKVVSSERIRAPGTSTDQPTTLIQYLIPVLDINWLAVITSSTANEPLAAGLEVVADQMAASLTFGRKESPSSSRTS